MENSLLHNPHVGEILKHEFLEELNINEKALAEAIGVSHLIIQKITQAKSPINAEIDLRLCRYFKLSEGYFLRLQNAYELMEAKRKLGETLNQIAPHSSLT
ncbi:MAG: HigA family addiction module antitoxin [Xenococcaceae cyanobacterium MO_207.B15]|nr:HigA family addiction module antitoxin [Xenococcaceae cyanobacterium MO_207.B15]